MAEIRLHKLRQEHLEKVMKWRMSPEVTRYMFTDPILTMDRQIKWYEKISQDPSVLYWVVHYDGKDIGVLNLYDIDRLHRRCSKGFYIGDLAYRGLGIASILEYNVYEYVFYSLCLNKVWVEVLAWNKKALYIYQKFGCEVEGVFKEHIIKNGEKMDVIRLGLLKSKWDKIRNQFNYPLIYIEE